MNVLGRRISSPETSPEARSLLARQRSEIQSYVSYGTRLSFEVDCSEVTAVESKLSKIVDIQELSSSNSQPPSLENPENSLAFDWQSEIQAIQEGKHTTRSHKESATIENADDFRVVAEEDSITTIPAVEALSILAFTPQPGELITNNYSISKSKSRRKHTVKLSLSNSGNKTIRSYHLQLRLGDDKASIRKIRTHPIPPGQNRYLSVEFTPREREYYYSFTDVSWKVISVSY